MAQPPAYNRETDFTERDGDDTNHEAINTELDGAAQSINAIRDNLALIQRDDGGLTPGIVDGDALSQDAFNAVLGATVEAVQASETAANNAALASATALTAAGNASTSADEAAASAVDAANSASQSASAAQNLFDSIYLGALSADPVVDGNGDPLTDGDFYYNTVAKLIRMYDSSSGGFVAATPSGQFKRQVFVDGVDFVAGTDDTLTLLSDPVTAMNVFVHFDAAYQQPTEYTRSGLDIVFDAPIPLGVTQVEVAYLEAVSIGIPADESVTNESVAADAGIESGKLAHTEPGGDETTVKDMIDALGLQDYVALRAYAGLARTVRITGLLVTAQPQGIAGFFQYDETDTTSADNGGTIIVGADGRRWKRVYDGAVFVDWWGAVGDGVTSDYAAIQAAFDNASDIGFSDKAYFTDQTLTLGTQKRIFGPAPQGHQTAAPRARLTSTIAALGDQVPILKLVTTGQSGQCVMITNLGFAGDLSINFADLSLAASTGIIGVDVSGVKEGVTFSGCSFRNLLFGVKQVNPSPFLDKTTFDRCHLFYCRTAIDANPTAGLHLTNSFIYDCYDWINSTSDVTLICCSLNNSTFSQEQCNVVGRSIVMEGGWIEGGNQWFAPTAALHVRGVYFSESYSASGGTKFSVRMVDSISVKIEGCRIATNTRLFNFTQTNYKTQSIELNGNYGPGVNFANLTGINSYLQLGLVYKGQGNTNTDQWNRHTVQNDLLFGDFQSGARTDLFRAMVKPRRFLLEVNTTFSLACAPSNVSYLFSNDRYEYIRLKFIASNNGAGGTVAFMADYTIYKANGTVWTVFAEGPDTTAWTIGLSNQTNSGVDITVTINHTGNADADVVFVCEGSENMTIQF